MTVTWCMVPEIWKMQQTEFIIILDHFLPFYSPNNPKNQNFEKMKQNSRDIIILHKCTIYDNHMMHGSWDMKCDRHNFLSFWTIFCHFNSLTTQKIKILKKWKKMHGDIILHMCTINKNQMIYGSWDIEHDRQIFLSFWTIFCPFNPQQPKISKFWKNEKNTWRYYHFTHVYHKWQSYDVWFLRYEKCERQNFLSFSTIFCLDLLPQQSEKWNFWKTEENNWRYYQFTHVSHKWKSYDVCFLRYRAWQTDFFVILDHFLPF